LGNVTAVIIIPRNTRKRSPLTRGRPVENAPIGNRIENPAVDFAQLAKSMGVYAEGPILRSEDIEPALRRAPHIIKTEKHPALVDVFTQNR